MEKLENRPGLYREQKFLHAGRMLKANASEQGLLQAFEQGDEMIGPYSLHDHVEAVIKLLSTYVS